MAASRKIIKEVDTVFFALTHMPNYKLTRRIFCLLLVMATLVSPLLAQQKRNVPGKPTTIPERVPTFDSLLAEDSYKVYCEIRGVGGLIRSAAVNDLLDPVMRLGGPPSEVKTAVKWLNRHADVLAGSRMMVASWRSRPELPNVLIAIEFSSPEEAKKFYPELRDFIPKLLPTPTPTPSPTPAPPLESKPAPKLSGKPSDTQVTRAELVVGPMAQPQNIPSVSERGAVPEPPRPPYQMQQAGSLVLISDTAFTFRNLRPRGSKALEEDQNFLLARNRFSTESIFLYFDLKSLEKEQREQREKWEEEQKRAEAEAANSPKVDETMTEMADPEETVPSGEEQSPPPELPAEEPTIVAATADPEVSSHATLSSTPASGPDEMTPMFYSLYGAFFGGESKWPEAVGAALVFEGDAYVVRTLILNSAESEGNPIPFFPQFISGPAMAPQSPDVLPADVDLFVSVSLDYPQVYEGMLKALAQADERGRKNIGGALNEAPPQTSFAVFEKKLGLKIKDDLLPLLGNELALALPQKVKKTANEPVKDLVADNATGAAAGPQKVDATPNPVIAIAVKDREAVGRLIPKIIESFGLKGASLLAQTEKRDGTELVSYAGVFSYAFVGDFLVVSPDAAATRHVVDAYLEHQTLSSDSHFRNYTRWQPRQVLGQVYAASSMVEPYMFGSGASGAKLTEFLSGVNPVIDPLTYSLSNDGLGPLHELHVPRNLLQVLVATMVVGASEAVPMSNEATAKSIMRIIASAEKTFKETEANKSYGTLDQLASGGLISKDMVEKYGYKIEVSASGDKFEITAVPIEYGKTGKLSFFIDESQVLRGGDHGGGGATVADQPVD